MEETQGDRKVALLLQGPIGSFFKTLGRVLEADGFVTHQVAFNAGDLVNARWSNTHCYNKGRENWSSWLERLLKDKRVTIVILFGSERFHHKVARKLCNDLDIPVLSLEEGYVRPGYITAEWGGNNLNSPVANLPAEKIVSAQKPTDVSPFNGKNFGKVVWLGFLYYNIRAVGSPYFNRAMYHKTRPVVSEALKWIRNFYRWLTGKRRNREIVERLLNSLKGNFFFIPLQVSDDQQLTEAGLGWTNDQLIEKSISSFLKHAPQDTSLVFKLHPMERGHSNDVARIQHIAAKKNAESRIHVIDDGPLGELVKVSRGMITINSTSGLSGLLHRVPVGVLGKSIYRRPDLATCIENDDDLDRFWTTAKTCDPEMAVGFRNSLFANALLPGDYYIQSQRLRAAQGIVDLITKTVTRKVSKSRV